MPVLTAPVQLSPHLFIVYSEYPHVDSGNVYLVAGQYPTLIDCGSERAGPQLVRNLAQLDLRVSDLRRVIATHGDYDHTQGFNDLHRQHPGLRLRLHRHDWPTGQASDAYRNCGYLYGRPFAPFEVNQCEPLEDGDALPSGDTTLLAVHTPGHTEGSTCLLGDIDGRAVLFAGDAIGGGMRSLEGAELQVWAQAIVTWQASLRRLADLDFEWILNGHEPAAALPMGRALFDRLVPWFGKMLNPWFLLAEDDTANALETRLESAVSPAIPGH